MESDCATAKTIALESAIKVGVEVQSLLSEPRHTEARMPDPDVNFAQDGETSINEHNHMHDSYLGDFDYSLTANALEDGEVTLDGNLAHCAFEDKRSK